MIEVLHEYLMQPEVTPEDRIVHKINFLSSTVRDAVTTVHHKQLSAISRLRKLFSS